MKDAKKKQALAKVFGVVNRDSVMMGVPMIPGLRKKITCVGCELKTKKGLPVEFEQYMSEEQKAEFVALTKRKRTTKKKKE